MAKGMSFCLLIALVLYPLSNAVDPLPNSVCMTSLWGSVIKQSMIKVSTNSRDLPLAKVNCCSDNRRGGWCGNKRSSDNWIEVDFPHPTGLRGIILQKNEGNSAYAKTIQLQYMQDGQTTWSEFSNDPAIPRDINALNNSIDQLTLSMTGLVVTKLKIKIASYQREPCLRFDLLGCSNGDDLCPQSCQNNGVCSSENHCKCQSGFTGDLCQSRSIQTGECKDMLGMANGGITDNMLHVSSSAPGKGKEKARYGCCEGQEVGAWCPDQSDKHPWYQVDLKSPKAVSGLAFLHPARQNQQMLPTTYMKTFDLMYVSALDPQKQWRTYADGIPAIFNSTVYYNVQLQPFIVTDSIRIYPKTYENAACFRFEVVGCNPSELCQSDWCQNGGTCMGDNLCKCPNGFYGDRCDKAAQSLKTYTFSFTQIVQQVIHTSISVNFQIVGNVKLIGQTIVIEGTNSYMTIDNQGFNSCIKDIDTCNNGFALSVKVNFPSVTNGVYIISSGGDLPNSRGIALYYSNHQLHYVVTTSTKRWHLAVPYTLTANKWYTLDLSWSKTLGVELLENGHLIGSVSRPAPVSATQVRNIAIGYGYTQTLPISLKVNGFQTYDANREVLVNNGVINGTLLSMTDQLVHC